MEDLAFIVTLMLFIPIIVGLIAITFSILQRRRPQFRLASILLTATVGVTAVLGLIQYPPLGVFPAIETFIAVIFLFLPKSKSARGL